MPVALDTGEVTLIPCLGRDRIGAANRKRALHEAARVVLAVIIAAIALTGVSTARAATITVDTIGDPGLTGTCDLRDAITAANTKTTTGTCAAGSGIDMISFGVTGQIALGSSLPDIVSGETLTIQGPATSAEITIDGGGKYQVMVVDSGGTLNIANLTIANGISSPGSFHGGGIVNEGTLTVTNSTFYGNSAGSGGGAAASTTKAR